MATGAIIGGIVSGISAISNYSASKKASKQADRYNSKAEEYTQFAIDQINLGYEESLPYIEGAYGEASGALNSMYGAALGALAEGFNLASGTYNEALDRIQTWLNEWEDIYGGLEQNVADYYTNLDPDKYAAEWKTSLHSDMQKQLTQFQQNLSQYGLTTSGMNLQAQKESAFALAEGEAQIDMAAPEYVAAQQQSYLEPALNRRTGLRDADTQLRNNLAQTQYRYGSDSAQLQANWGSALANLATWYGGSMSNLTQNKYNSLANVYGSQASGSSSMAGMYSGQSDRYKQSMWQNIGSMAGYAGQIYDSYKTNKG